MDKIKKNQVLEILDYWKTVEFLGQIDIREESQENRKAAGKTRMGRLKSSQNLRYRIYR